MQARFVGPKQYDAALKPLKAAQGELAAAKQAAQKQRGLMMVAMFSEAGYAAALSKLKTLP